jgi:hypothetical protein
MSLHVLLNPRNRISSTDFCPGLRRLERSKTWKPAVQPALSMASVQGVVVLMR